MTTYTVGWIDSVYPIFIVQAIAFLLFFLPSNARFLGIKTHTWIILVLLVVNVGIAFSLRHDMTEILNLHF